MDKNYELIDKYTSKPLQEQPSWGKRCYNYTKRISYIYVKTTNVAMRKIFYIQMVMDMH